MQRRSPGGLWLISRHIAKASTAVNQAAAADEELASARIWLLTAIHAVASCQLDHLTLLCHSANLKARKLEESTARGTRKAWKNWLA
eukprot:1500521-Karenia_brevis.AAC.1